MKTPKPDALTVLYVVVAMALFATLFASSPYQLGTYIGSFFAVIILYAIVSKVLKKLVDDSRPLAMVLLTGFICWLCAGALFTLGSDERFDEALVTYFPAAAIITGGYFRTQRLKIKRESGLPVVVSQ